MTMNISDRMSYGEMTRSDFDRLPDSHCPPCPLRLGELHAMDIDRYPIYLSSRNEYSYPTPESSMTSSVWPSPPIAS